MSNTWLFMTAAELGHKIGAGAIDARDLTEVYLDAIAGHHEADRIYARTTPERARAEAAASAARFRNGARLGPLDGVPISWKDLFDIAGVETEAGSALLRGRKATRDAAVVATAARSGLVCLGKTHMTELAFSGLGINPNTATPPNVHDAALAPGGSSSGAAASVAFGLAVAGIGSDTGGSVRVPAAWNNLVGLKTSPGLISLEGVTPLCPSFDTVGPLCRTVEDMALLLCALSGARPLDMSGAHLRGVRLLAIDTTSLGETRREPAAAFESAVSRLGGAGVRIERRRIAAAEHAFDLAGLVFAGEAYGAWGEAIEADPEAMFAPIRERFRSGAGHTAAALVRGWTRLKKLRAEFNGVTAAYDAVIAPTTANLPPVVERLLDNHELFNSENLLTLRNTRIANLMGLCALTLPLSAPSCGLMAMAPSGAEKRLLRLGAALEQALQA
jgi:aspartyl-tRNA(Asn)/glutamyl-tRNA(Gln) amidotransferase subunit A